METREDKNGLKTIDPQVAEIIQQFATDAKNLLKEQVIAEYLFGSYATNTQTSLSDIDILILVNQYTPELQWQMSGLASDYSLEYDLCFSPILTGSPGMEEKPTSPDTLLPRNNRTWDSLMNDPAIIDLSHHRLNKAKEALRQAELLLQNAGYDGSTRKRLYSSDR